MEGGSPCLVWGPDSQSQQSSHLMQPVSLPSTAGKKAEWWGPFWSTCQGPHPKLPGVRDTPQGTRAQTQGRLRLPASARGAALSALGPGGQPGGWQRAAQHFPSPLSRLLPGRESHSHRFSLGKGEGGAADLGWRQGWIREKETAVPSKLPSLSLFTAPPAPRPSPSSYPRLAVHCSPWTPHPLEGPCTALAPSS